MIKDFKPEDSVTKQGTCTPASEYDDTLERSDARIYGQLSFSEDMLANLEESLRKHVDIISVILYPESHGSAAITAPPPGGPTSPLSAKIDAINSKILELEDYLKKITERVQL